MFLPTQKELHLGVADIFSGFKLHRVWWRLALLARKEQQKRSILGPLWNTIGILIMILLFGLLYAKLLGQRTTDHLPYVACGLVIWSFYAEVVTRSCIAFASNAVFIQQMTLPKSVYVYRLLALEIIGLSYSVTLIIIPVLLFTKGLSWHMFLSLFGFALILLNVFSVAILLAVISLRYRDVAPLVGHIMRPLMFLTPIIWNADNFPDRAIFIHWNPFFHIVEVFRGPLLGETPALFSYVFLVVLTGLCVAASLSIFSRYRARVAFWV